MSHFHKLHVTGIRKLTSKAVEVSLSPVDSKIDFSYLAGQYLTFCFDHEGEELRRSYSLCSSPGDSELKVGVKQLEGGRISTHFNKEMKVGDEVNCMVPEGNFVLKENDEASHYVFFAAGSGITPIISIIRVLLQKYPQHKVSLFYGNRSQEEIMFKDELFSLSDQNDNFKLYHILSDGSNESPLFNGRISFGKATELLYNFCNDPQHKEFYICGPSGMMVSVQNALEDAQVNQEQIHVEYFEAPDQDPLSQQKEEDEVFPDFEGPAKVKIILDDEEFEYELDSKGDSILNATLDQGADAPYSCKGGVCTTCKALVLKGKVKMDSDFALTDGEKEEGYVLTCQSHPCSEEVVISYDE